jgi:UDP-N-acetylmuramoylalanine--D-glutamate ligase
MFKKIPKTLNNKKLGFLGLGTENLSLIKFLLKNKVNCRITVCDPKSAAELGDRFLEIKQLARKQKLPEIILMSGKNYDAHLTDFDIVFRSPGYPLFAKNLVKAQKVGVEISSAMKMFFELCPTKKIIGVTGSKGKGTTSSLIYAILKAAKKKVYLGGNIGIAPFDFIEKLQATDFVVLELSSFQLEDLTVSPQVAVITNLYKEHLAPADPNNPNYHKTIKAYVEAKANIFSHQKKGDWLLLKNETEKQLTSYLKKSPLELGAEKVFYYFSSDLPSKLIGKHNQENIDAALKVAEIFKIKPEVAARAVKSFSGLPHRLEFVAEIKGAKYFDDSFATVPEVSEIALKSFDAPIILLAGGADKGSSFKSFAKEIEKRVKFLILFKGKGSDLLKKEIQNTKYKIPNTKMVDNMKDAMALAKKAAKPGDVVLLSTGCASFGCFKNYKERGDQFKKAVKE